VLFRRGIKDLLAGQNDLQFASEAGNYGDALKFLRSNPCDLVMTDLSMPGRDGLDLVCSIKATFPKLPILVLTMHAEEEYATRAIRSGANGFLTKDAEEEELLEAIRRVARGQTAISHRVAEFVAVQLSRRQDSATSLTALSGREFKIYEMLARGMRVSAIARELHLSVKTVSTYKVRLLQKLGLQSQSDVALHRHRHFADKRHDERAMSAEAR
jgi:DNA-binding NarL/FixJ family response regulator